jgi:NADH-quinone oxidoreductase subunit L
MHLEDELGRVMEQGLQIGFFLQNAWLVPAIPLVSFLIVGLIIRPVSDRLSGVLATLAIFITAAVVYAIAWEYFHLPLAEAGRQAFVPWSFEWLRYQERLTVNLGVLIDPISVLLMIVVTTVSSLVHLYSIGYMHGESGYGRYFTYLNLFTFSMLGLVGASNILQIYVFWELVGVSSFLLIGFYYQRPSAVAASKKAFIVTRFADLGFFIGILVLGYFGYQIFGELGASAAGQQPFDFLFLSRPDVLARLGTVGPEVFGVGILTLAMVLVYMGAAGKSAMFPLHIWLPDAMEGPTPVSALIHAATMVVAGVYLVARMFPVFAASGDALTVVAVIGAFTSLFAAVIACTQDDIKRVLAFSTLSQLGYMMFALGVSSFEHPLGYTASMFHLFTHAFFKALLFLGAGALIHAVHSNSIWDMGGLRKKMPLTHVFFLIATLAISGIWPFAGFYSKDEILAAALSSQHYGVFAVGLLVAGMTAFYMFRIYFVSFLGVARTEKAGHAHEAPVVMLIPLGVLAVFSVIAGWVPFGDFVSIGHASEHGGGNHTLVAISGSVAAVFGISISWLLYGRGHERAEAVAQSFGGLYTLVKQKFYFDELYLFVTHKVIFGLVARPIAWFDRHVVDGGVNLSAWSTRMLGASLRELQTGQVQVYGAWVIVGVITILLYLGEALK